MNENYDTFEPFLKLNKISFAFKPKCYKIWQNGRMTAEGKTCANVNARVTTQNGYEQMVIHFIDENLKNEICSEIFFDEFVTIKNRLSLITIPQNMENDDPGMAMYRMTIGATRQKISFKTNEPYSCSLFLSNKVIKKINMNFNNPEKLIELYA